MQVIRSTNRSTSRVQGEEEEEEKKKEKEEEEEKKEKSKNPNQRFGKKHLFAWLPGTCLHRGCFGLHASR